MKSVDSMNSNTSNLKLKEGNGDKYSLSYDIDNQEWSLAQIFDNSYNTTTLSPESIADCSRWGKLN